MIYIHIPFCKSFCTYCGFYSEICSGVNVDKYIGKVKEEISSRRDEILSCSATDTLYIGGGTPSVLPLSAMQSLIQALGKHDFEEFTIEVNPEDIVTKGEDYVRGLIELGVNRISMGVQSFDDKVLKWMNRRHDSIRAEKAFGILRKCGIDNISIDLMFGIPGLTDEVWRTTLDKALDLSPEHLSAYQLSIEDGTPLESMIESGKISEQEEEVCRRQYEMLCRSLKEAGYNHYEVSNFARPGFEARHNSAYWKRVPYVGLGAGAHSFIICPDGSQKRFWNTPSFKDYTRDGELLSPEDVRVETLFLSLRTAEGLDYKALMNCADTTVAKDMLSEGLLIKNGDGKVRIPESHFFISDEIIRRLV